MIQLSRPFFTEAEAIACQKVLDTGFLVQGKNVLKFERGNIKHMMLAVTSMTSRSEEIINYLMETNLNDPDVPLWKYVEISKNNCVDTSACYNIVLNAITDFEKESNVTIFQNPSTNMLTIHRDCELTPLPPSRTRSEPSWPTPPSFVF